MIVTVNKWGNSQGIRVPKEVLKELHVHVGSAMEATIHDGKLVLEAVPHKKYSIHELAHRARHTSSENVDWGAPKGCEEW